MRRSSATFCLLLTIAWLLTAGCARGPYQFGQFAGERPAEVHFEYGEPHEKLDKLEHIVGWPRRVLPFVKKDPPPGVSDETADKLRTYLERNQLTDVRVSVRDYQPREQWRRLKDNRDIAGVWRYTVGAMTIVQYTVLPGRVFSRNEYNPFTNTLYINSDEPARVLHEAAYAKDIHGRTHRGTYAAAGSVPGLSLWRQVRGVNDVVLYTQTHGDWDTEQKAYQEIYPHIGSQGMSAAVSPFFPVWWADPIMNVAGSAVGRTVGHVAKTRRQRERDEAANSEDKVDANVTPASHSESVSEKSTDADE